jgi:hypothetical protein
MLGRINRSLVVALLLLPALASAYEQKAGIVKKVSVNSPAFSNRSVIVELEGVTVMCTGGTNQGYVNKADAPDTFAAILSTLLAAQATGRPVVVYTIPGTEGCRIDQVQLSA